MNLPSEFPVTVFPHAADADAAEVGTVAAAIAIIQGERYAQQVAWIRLCRGNGDPTAEDAKRQLPVILWSGVFRRRANDALTAYTGLVVLDLDDLADSALVREQLRHDPHIVCCFRSPGGDGCKPVMRTDATSPAEHRAAWLTACRYLKGAYDLVVSGGQGDVARACFASHDPQAWINEGAVPLAVDRSLVAEGAPVAASGSGDSGESGERISKDRHQYLVAYCARLARAGLGAGEIAAAAEALVRDRFDLSDGRQFPPAEIRRAVDSAVAKYAGADQAAHAVHGAEVATALIAAYEAGLAGAAPPGDHAGLVLRTHEDRLRECLHPPPQLVEGLLPVGGIGALIALPGQGKTLVALELARCIASGEPFAGRAVSRGEVVYLATDSPDDTERRMLGLGEAVAGVYSVAEAPRFPAGIGLLELALDRVPACRLVVLDTWDSTREHGDGGYSAQDAVIEGTMAELRRLAKARSLAVVVVHHATRADTLRARGSVVFDARCDFIGTVEQQGAALTLTATKVRAGATGEVGRWMIAATPLDAAPDAPPVPRLEPASTIEAAAVAGEAVVARRETRIAQVLAVLVQLPAGQGLTKRELMEAVGLHSSRGIADLSDEMRRAGWMLEGSFTLTAAGRAHALGGGGAVAPVLNDGEG